MRRKNSFLTDKMINDLNGKDWRDVVYFNFYNHNYIGAWNTGRYNGRMLKNLADAERRARKLRYLFNCAAPYTDGFVLAAIVVKTIGAENYCGILQPVKNPDFACDRFIAGNWIVWNSFSARLEFWSEKWFGTLAYQCADFAAEYCAVNFAEHCEADWYFDKVIKMRATEQLQPQLSR